MELSRRKLLKAGMVGTALTIVPSIAMASDECGFTQFDLTAGQKIKIGTVTISNDGDNLYIVYQLNSTYINQGAVITQVHIWAGTDLDNLPKNPKGILVPGHFPFIDENLNQTSYVATIPLADAGILDVEDACGVTLYVVTHAAVDLNGLGTDGGGQTAFGGDQPGGGKRWWFYAAYAVCCPIDNPIEGVCHTAFAKGTHRLFNIGLEDPPPFLFDKNGRWGWAIKLTAPGETTYDIWASAGQNDTNNGTLVGTLTVNWTDSVADVGNKPDTVTVQFQLIPGYRLGATHVYAEDAKPDQQTASAPGQYGNLHNHDQDDEDDSDTFTLALADAGTDGVWIIAHAEVCTIPAAP